MPASVKVNVTDIVGRSKLGAFQWTIFVLCGLCVVMEGFDLQAMGYVAPALTRDWHIPPSMLGPVFSAALVGVLIGSLACSVLADKIGRRPVLMFGAMYFSIFTLLVGRATSVSELMFFRFLGGIGLGGMMPNAMALVGEFSPQNVRVTAMMVIGCGLTAGAAVGGFISAWLIPSFGWRSVFFFCSPLEFLLGLLMLALLPESLQFLAVKGRESEKIRRGLKRIDPSAPDGPNIDYMVIEEKKEGMPATHLFREGRMRVTLLLWVVNFMNLLNLYFLASWVPTVVRNGGYSTAIAVLVGTAVQVGGTIGAFGNSWFISKVGFSGGLACIFAVGAVSIAFIGQPFLSLPFLFMAVFLAGWCVPGGQPGVNVFAAVYYPTYLRSTGIGWGLGIGRIGAIIGPVVGGALIAMKWTPRDVFLAAAIPAAISAITMLGLTGAIKTPEPVRSKNSKQGARGSIMTDPDERKEMAKATCLRDRSHQP
jgi:AAHS family 4-hydroxybenzoate transporter-like MFS transporter